MPSKAWLHGARCALVVMMIGAVWAGHPFMAFAFGCYLLMLV